MSNSFSKNEGKHQRLPKLSLFLQYPVGEHTGIGSGWCEWHRRSRVRGKGNRHRRAGGCLNRRRRCCRWGYTDSGGNRGLITAFFPLHEILQRVQEILMRTLQLFIQKIVRGSLARAWLHIQTSSFGTLQTTGNGFSNAHQLPEFQLPTRNPNKTWCLVSITKILQREPLQNLIRCTTLTAI
jgi:hypothetical protein